MPAAPREDPFDMDIDVPDSGDDDGGGSGGDGGGGRDLSDVEFDEGGQATGGWETDDEDDGGDDGGTATVDPETGEVSGSPTDLEFDEGGTSKPAEQQQPEPDPSPSVDEYQPPRETEAEDISDDPVPTQVDRDELRFAEEETTIAGVTYQEGEALPPRAMIAQDLERQVTADDAMLGRGDVGVYETDRGLQTDLTRAGVERLARADPEDVLFEDEARRQIREPQTPSGARQQAIAEDIYSTETDLSGQLGRMDSSSYERADIDLQRGEDVRVEDLPGGGYRLEFTDEFQRETATESARRQLGQPGFEVGDELEYDEDEGVSLTPRGRRAVIGTEVADQGYVEVEDEPTDVPLLDFQFGGGTERREVEDLSQLEFDEEGNLVGVSEAPDATFEENVQALQESEYLAGPTEEAAAVGLAGSKAVVEGLGDDFGEAADWVGDEIIPRTRQFAETTTSVPFLLPEAAAGAAGAEGAEEAIQSTRETVTGAAGQFTAGAWSTVPMAISLPETIARGTEAAGEGAAFTAEEGVGEGARAASGAVGGVVVESAQSAVENPIQTTGTLAGSAALMGGASAVSSRAGLATRGAIQPGEELLGYGGSAALSRTGGALSRAGNVTPGRAGSALSRTGAGTERASDVLFPRNEPLIFSEEAAIAGARRAGGAARSAGGRVRDVLGRTTVRSRPGMGLGGFQLEVEAETESEAETVDLLEEEALAEPPGSELQRSFPPHLDPERDVEPDTRTQQRRRQRYEEGGDPRPDADRFTASRISPGETAVQREMGRLEEAQRPFFDTTTRVESEVEQAPRVEVGADGRTLLDQAMEPTEMAENTLAFEPMGVETRTRTDTRTGVHAETRTDVETEQETEQELEQRLEQRLEQETEQELEMRVPFEAETEGRIEAELPDDPDTDGPRPLLPESDTVGQELISDFRDPLTGDVIETERGAGSDAGVTDLLGPATGGSNGGGRSSTPDPLGGGSGPSLPRWL